MNVRIAVLLVLVVAVACRHHKEDDVPTDEQRERMVALFGDGFFEKTEGSVDDESSEARPCTMYWMVERPNERSRRMFTRGRCMQVVDRMVCQNERYVEVNNRDCN